MADIDNDEAARRARQEAMERMLLEGEQQEEADPLPADAGALDGAGAAAGGAGNADEVNNDNIPVEVYDAVNNNSSKRGLNYPTSSFILASFTLWYALRTREQWYLALVFLGSSKVAYCVLGNALVAGAVVTFDWTVRIFLNGLRVMEAEGLQDFFRWNVTETCLALTMFRQELTIHVAVQFLLLVLIKCLHHVAVLREQHLRMTDDAVRGATWNENVPVVPWHHCKVLMMLFTLQSLDLLAVQYTADDLINSGPSVSILFAFEAAILLVSAWSSILLWYIHVADGLLHFWHDRQYSFGHALLHPWKEIKATLTFAVELQAQAVQFLFYLAFFGFVMTYYGMPINLFREVYVSFMALKERLWAFMKYRRLMASMNRFATPTAEQLEEAGRVCIICRDEMTLHDCKALPVCQHLFHKSCLREWLTQQQSCPTCRSDIASMEAQQATRQAAAAAANQRQQHEEPQVDEQQAQPLVAGEEAARDASPTQEAHDDAEDVGGDASTTNQFRSTPVQYQQQQQQSPTVAISPTTFTRPSDPQTPLTTSSREILFSTDQETRREPDLTFPALYRVVHERGAVVWDKENDSIVRRVPLGVVLFCRDLQHLTIAGEAADYLQIPDGWVEDDAVLRICDNFGLLATTTD